METYNHELSGAKLRREIAQPNVDRFAEIFEDWKPFDLMGLKAIHATGKSESWVKLQQRQLIPFAGHYKATGIVAVMVKK